MILDLGGVLGAIVGAVPFAAVVYFLCWYLGDRT